MFACLSDLRKGELAGLPSEPPRRYRFAWYPALGEFRVFQVSKRLCEPTRI